MTEVLLYSRLLVDVQQSYYLLFWSKWKLEKPSFDLFVLSSVAWIFSNMASQVVHVVKGLCEKWANHVDLHQ